MKVALIGTDWEDSEKNYIESNLGEITLDIESAGSDVKIGMSKLPAGTKYFVMERCFDRRRRAWTVVSDTLEGAVEKAKEKIDASSN